MWVGRVAHLQQAAAIVNNLNACFFRMRGRLGALVVNLNAGSMRKTVQVPEQISRPHCHLPSRWENPLRCACRQKLKAELTAAGIAAPPAHSYKQTVSRRSSVSRFPLSEL